MLQTSREWSELWQEWELLETLAVSAPRGTLPELEQLAQRMAAVADRTIDDADASAEGQEMRAVHRITDRLETGGAIDDEELTASLAVLRGFVDRLNARVTAQLPSIEQQPPGRSESATDEIPGTA